ncbi:hypothetical protein THII_3748 [Thioploca ingrica]|uniref:Uncharacterized protein n=1 Tax=Thioploca ingrica TaxID=40754 RepID=A0A090AQS7_9GAMM|nr:hypothetical protein THII_3748 [Thioploca ingrica]
MSTAKLNVYVTELGQPCTITNRNWVVAIAHCDGTVLNWSEGRWRTREDEPWHPIPLHTPPGTPPHPPGYYYESIPAYNGHVEIQVPPGCYVLSASMHTWYLNGVLLGNWYTHNAIIQACCGEDTCVTLYAPTKEACGWPLFEFVIPLLMQHQAINRDQATRAIEAMRAIFKPEAASTFEQGQFGTLRSAFEQMGKELLGQEKCKPK